MAALPQEAIELLRPHLKLVTLEQWEVLARPGEPFSHVYFPHTGVTSHLVVMDDGSGVDAAVSGCEGVVGVPALLTGPDTPSINEVVMQVAGSGERIVASTLWVIMEECAPLRHVLHRSVLAMLNQVTRTSACNRLHKVPQRSARWLLQVHDRVEGDAFPLTHEYLAMMLGVRRASVSLTLEELHRAGLISTIRGVITVLDRAGLEGVACEDYRLMREEYEHMFAFEAKKG